MTRAIRILLALAGVVWWQSAAAAEWREAETEHFRITSSGSEKDLRKFAERLEQFHTLLGLATGANEAERRNVKVRVYLVSSIDEVKRLFGNRGSSVAGFYQPREDGAIAVVPRKTGSGVFNGQLVLFHEYAHHYMLQYTPAAYPTWYVEGFAELASTASFERKGGITYGKPASHRQGELEHSSRYSPAEMVDGTYLEADSKSGTWGYGDAWLLTHYLTFSDERRGQLRKYLNSINAGQEPEKAARIFGDLDALHRDVGSYLRGRSFPYRLVPVAKHPNSKIRIRDLTEAEAELVEFVVEMGRKTRLPERPDPDAPDALNEEDYDSELEDFEERLAKKTAERDEWLTKLERVAANYPTSPATWEALADATCESELYDKCLSAAKRTLAIAPERSRAVLREAEASIALAAELPDQQRIAQVLAAQERIVDILARRPDDPVALFAYYRTFAALGIRAPKEAVDALLLGVQLVPQMSGPRLTLANQLVADGRLGDARIILKPLAYSPHSRTDARAARKLLDDIERMTGQS